jgi:hypothetical protein
MRIRGMLFGLVIYFVVIAFGSFLTACSYKETIDEKVIEQGNLRETEKTDNIQLDVNPEELNKSYLIKRLI